MAATHGRLTGRAGVCIATLGPGALNFSTAAAYAQLGAMPMILLTGQKAIMSGKQAKFQMVDVIASMKPLTKMARQIVSPKSIPTIVRDSFRVAEEERPGPVLLELPEDVAGYDAGEIPVVPRHALEWPVANPEAIARAVKLIQSAKRPLIMIGAASNRPRLVEELSNFVQRTGIPFFNTQMGKGAVTGCSGLYMGTAALSAGDYVHRVVDHADLIISIGHDTIEKPPFLMQSGGLQVIHIGYTSANVEEVFFPQAEVLGDIGNTLSLLADQLQDTLKTDPTFAALREEVLVRLAEDSTDDRFPVIPQRLVADIRKVMPEDGVVCLDNGMYKIWFARSYRTHVANTLLLDNALATMGAGLPSAMMAAMLHPTRRVLAVCGDGGFMMNSQEMETAVRLKLNLVVVVLNDSAYGMIRWKQAVDNFPDFGLTFGNPDFVKYAESYGARGSRVTATRDLVPALEAAFKGGGVHLVDVPIDYSENVRVLIDELKGRVSEIDVA